MICSSVCQSAMTFIYVTKFSMQAVYIGALCEAASCANSSQQYRMLRSPVQDLAENLPGVVCGVYSSVRWNEIMCSCICEHEDVSMGTHLFVWYIIT